MQTPGPEHSTSSPGRSKQVVIIAGALLLDLAIASCWPNLGTSCVATVLFTLALVALLRAEPVGTWLLFPFILLQLSVLVSLNVIDAGAYMVEMGRAGKPTAAAAAYACYSLLLLITSIGVYRALRARTNSHGGRTFPQSPEMHGIFQYCLVGCGAGCAAYLLIAGLRTGFPVLMGIDRFEFRRLFADMSTVNILNLKSVLACALGTVAALTHRRLIKWGASGAFAALMGVSFLYGDKFFIILIAIGVFVLPLVIRNPDSAARMILRAAPWAAVGVASALAVTFLMYSDFGARSSSATFEKLGDRVAGQGQLWQMAVEHSPGWIDFDPGKVRENLASLVAENSQDFVFRHHLTAEYFVYRYSPPAMYRSFLHNAGYVTPTMAYEAYGLVMFGYLGLALLMAMTGVFFGCLIAYLHGTIERGELLGVLLPAYVLTQAIKFFTQGTLYNLLSLSTLKWYAALWVLHSVARVLARGLSADTFASRGRMTPMTHISP
jgi:uncharacterized membrane protein YhaH (DUF805 family)